MTRGTWQGSGTFQTDGPDPGIVVAVLIAVLLLGGSGAAVAAAVTSLLVIAAVVVGVLVLAAAAVLFFVWRATRRREAAYAVSDRHQRIMAEAGKPQVTQGAAPPAIEYHVHNHYHAAEPGAARVIPGRVLP